VSVTRLVLWNSGTDILKKADVKTPLALQVTGHNHVILDKNVLAQHLSTGQNNFDCTRSADRSRLTITFDFMDPGQGIVVQVFHTGLSNKDFLMDGYVQGAGKPKWALVAGGNNQPLLGARSKKSSMRNRTKRILAGWGALLLPLLLLWAGLSGVLDSPNQVIFDPPLPAKGPRWGVWLVFLLFYGLMLATAFLLLRKGVPRELSVFEED
jgi:hypothetical protein